MRTSDSELLNIDSQLKSQKKKYDYKLVLYNQTGLESNFCIALRLITEGLKKEIFQRVFIQSI